MKTIRLPMKKSTDTVSIRRFESSTTTVLPQDRVRHNSKWEANNFWAEDNTLTAYEGITNLHSS